MNVHDAAFSVANTVTDLRNNSLALVACVKQICQDPKFEHALRPSLVDIAQRVESIANRELK